MLLMLENQVAATGSKDKNNRSIIVKWKFHGTFSTSHFFNITFSTSRERLHRDVRRYVLRRLIKPQIIFSKVIILQTNCQIT